MTGYIYTVSAAAVVVSVLVTLAGQGSMGMLIKMIAGVFMALTVLSPLLKVDLPDPAAWIAGFESDGKAAAMAGEIMADDARRAIIKEQTEAYIVDKAARYGAAVEVEVQLDEQAIPAAVTLSGRVSPYARANLTRELAAELGLGEEVQKWIS